MADVIMIVHLGDIVLAQMAVNAEALLVLANGKMCILVASNYPWCVNLLRKQIHVTPINVMLPLNQRFFQSLDQSRNAFRLGGNCKGIRKLIISYYTVSKWCNGCQLGGDIVVILHFSFSCLQMHLNPETWEARCHTLLLLCIIDTINIHKLHFNTFYLLFCVTET